MSGDQLDHVNDQMLRLLSDIRPNAVPLVDAFDISDHTLGSVLGRFDGQVYENLYKWAQQSPLNKTQVKMKYLFVQSVKYSYLFLFIQLLFFSIPILSLFLKNKFLFFSYLYVFLLATCHFFAKMS